MRKKIAKCIQLVAVMAAVCVTAMFSCPCMAFAQSELDQANHAKQLKQQRLKLYHQEQANHAKQLKQQMLKLYHQGRYAEAIPLAQEVFAICKKNLGSEHPITLDYLNNIAMLYKLHGDYVKAEPLYITALQIREKILGLEHPDTAQSQNNLALLYISIGDYAKAEPLLIKALQIREKSLGPEHPDTANILNSLAGLYYSIGDFVKAETLYKRALQIREKVLGTENPDTAESLNNLAALYGTLGDFEKAESMFKRVLQIYEKYLGPEHPDTAGILNNLAGIYYSLGDFINAEALYIRALQIWEKSLGPEHPDTANSLNNLALLYDSLYNYAKAEPLLKRALQINEKALGPEHPATTNSLNNLGLVYANTDNLEKSFVLFHQAQQADEKLINEVMGFSSEDQKTKFINTKKWNLHGFFTLISQHFADKASARKDALDIWLKRKGLILEAQKKMQEALVYSDNPEMQTVYQEYSSVRARLSKMIFAGPGKEGLETWQKNKADLEAKKQELEAKLSRLSQEFKSKQKVLKADTDKIAKALPANSVLLEFARFGVCNFKAKGTENRWNPDHYLAFVLPAGKPNQVAMIDIGEAKKIDKAIEMFLFSFSRRSDNEILKERLDDSSIEDAKELYDLVFNPLRSALGSATEIFISPDGNLNLIPFEALVAPDGKFLVEEYTFNYLAAGRDILAFGDSREKGGKPVLMGDPDYDLEPAESAGTVQESETSEKTRSADMRGFKFKKFPQA